MTLQKFVKPLLFALCFSFSVPAFSNIVTPKTELTSVPGETNNKAAESLARLQEIKNMDLKNLSRAEKRDLRKEVKGIKKELKAQKNGIYLSLGAILIIILLLILLL